MCRDLVKVLENTIKFANKVSKRDPFLFATDGALVLVQARAALANHKNCPDAREKEGKVT